MKERLPENHNKASFREIIKPFIIPVLMILAGTVSLGADLKMQGSKPALTFLGNARLIFFGVGVWWLGAAIDSKTKENTSNK